MSPAADSEVQSSSSSDDFAEYLNAIASSLDVQQPIGDDEDEDDVLRRQWNKRLKMDSGVAESIQASTSIVTLEEEKDLFGGLDNQICPHPGFLKGMCIKCGQLEAGDGSAVAFGYIHKDLKLGSSEIERLRGADLEHLLRAKKLILILDLDHTLLNSARLSYITPEEEYLLLQAESCKADPNRNLFKLEYMHMLTKLRPFVRNFLREASSIFEMYVYTMAEKSYALEMANILDPDKIYFDSKVISEADCTQRHKKGLDVVLGAESTVVILDDNESVWPKHRENLIQMERYSFFASSSNNKSLSQLMKDENESDGVLATILDVLKRIHKNFFELAVGSDLSSRDVRQVLKCIRKEILRGCRIVFTRVFPTTEVVPEDEPIWRMAERLGAVCCKEVDLYVTHVVSADVGTEKSCWALQNDKFLVNPYWIEAANFLWRRQREEDFPVRNAKKTK